MKRWFLVAVLFLLVPLATAITTNEVSSITLLSVTQGENNTFIGGTAQLRLQLRPGHGAIFIETYPLSKIDTQVATRLANEIACSFSTHDCQNYDFFYTIRADAPVIGGPSAGGATALLTLAALEGIPLKKNLAMTGAISSGGIITPVGAVTEKVKAAKQSHQKIVLVPLLGLLGNNTSLATAELDKLKNISIAVKPVLTLQDALSLAAEKKVSFPESSFTVDKQYATQMKITANILCQRTSDMLLEITPTQQNDSLYSLAMQFFNQSLSAEKKENYYAKASFCYSANINLRELIIDGLSEKTRLENKNRLTSSLLSLEKQIDAEPLQTFSDLETYFIVKERALEAQQYLDEINNETHVSMNSTNTSSRLLALAIERYYSGVAWSAFFGLHGKPLAIDNSSLRIAALQEFEKVESRLNYLQMYLPDYFLEGTKEQLKQARIYFINGQYALALFKATKTRASANAYLSTMTLTDDNSPLLVLAKLNRTKEVIASQQTFPILGYSYYEYASDLVDSDTPTALLYSEYALAFSNLDNYFAPLKKHYFFYRLQKIDIFLFFTGLFVGVFIMFLKESFIKHKNKK